MELSSTAGLRAGTAADADALARLGTGPIAGKHDFIAESLQRRDVIVALLAGRTVGYIIWDHAFFGRAFVWLIGVDSGVRRQGIATRLLERFESACPGETLFTSTNASNVAMQQLLTLRGYTVSGRVENLDPGDPEIFYSKPPAGP